jgi:peptide/nickel transport system permease protein
MASESKQLATPGSTAELAASGERGVRRRSEWRAGLRVLFRNRVAFASIVFLLLVHLVALAAPLVAPADPEFIQIGKRFQRPNAEFRLGSDENGRDVLTRLIYGSRVSLLVGSLSVLLSVTIGTLAGAVAGYRGGFVDSLIMRFTDGMLTIPTFFLVLITVTVFGSTLRNVILVIALTSWMVIARVVRGDVLRTVNQDYILAARALGVPPARLVLRHVLPSAVPSIIVSTTLGVANAILTESALSYLGLGVQPPTSTWGNMLSGAQNYLFRRPELAIYPGVLIFLTVLAYNFFGDGLHDAMDPRYRHKA